MSVIADRNYELGRGSNEWNSFPKPPRLLFLGKWKAILFLVSTSK